MPDQARGGQRKLKKLRRRRSILLPEDAAPESGSIHNFEPHTSQAHQDKQDQVQVQAQDNGREDDDDDDDVDADDDADEEEQEDDDDKVRLAKFLINVAAFPSHMESSEGGAKSSEYAKLAAKRMWTLLEGTYLRSRKTRLEPSAVAIYAWTLSLIETEFAHISKFLDELAIRKGLKPNTLKTYLTSSYIPFFIWHRYTIMMHSNIIFIIVTPLTHRFFSSGSSAS